MGVPVKVAVVGLNSLKVRDVASLLNGTGDFDCRTAIPNPTLTPEMAEGWSGVVFMFPAKDIGRTGSWIETLRPATDSLLILDDLSVSRVDLLTALEAGADGIISWPASVREIREAIETAQRGGTPLPPELTTLLLVRLRNGRHVNPAWHHLTPCEARVMALVADGLSNKLIADRLGITTGTVQNHLNHVYARLGIHSRTEALAKLFGPAEQRPTVDARQRTSRSV